MKMTFLIALSILSMQVSAQIASTWKGNTPGHEKDWNLPANWSNNRIPDEFTDVFIPRDEKARTSYPVIMKPESEINSLHLAPDARLHITDGNLVVLDKRKSNYLANQIQGNGKVKSLPVDFTHDENAKKLKEEAHQLVRNP